jgi:hypothetical protein
MGHYAKVVDGIVTNVIVAEPEFFNTFVDSSAGDWVSTSYNMRGGVYYNPATGQPAADQSVITGNEARERKNFAGIGHHYDGIGFYLPQPYDSWTLNTSTYLWEAPVAYPTDGQSYTWNEETTSWDLVE